MLRREYKVPPLLPFVTWSTAVGARRDYERDPVMFIENTDRVLQTSNPELATEISRLIGVYDGVNEDIGQGFVIGAAVTFIALRRQSSAELPLPVVSREAIDAITPYERNDPQRLKRIADDRLEMENPRLRGQIGILARRHNLHSGVPFSGISVMSGAALIHHFLYSEAEAARMNREFGLEPGR